MIFLIEWLFSFIQACVNSITSLVISVFYFLIPTATAVGVCFLMMGQRNIADQIDRALQGPASPVPDDHWQGQINQMTEEKRGLETRIQNKDDEIGKLKAEIGKHKQEKEWQRNILESQSLEHEKAKEEMQALKSDQIKMTTKLDKLREKKNKLEKEKEEMIKQIALLEAQLKRGNPKDNDTVQVELDMMQTKMKRLEKALEEATTEEKNMRADYEEKISNLGNQLKRFITSQELQGMMENKTDINSATYSVYNEEILRNIRTLFVRRVMPLNVLHVFHNYNQAILTETDIESVTSITRNRGHFEGAAELLSRLVRYKDWYSCLLKVLRDQQVKQEPLAEEMEGKQAWDKIKNTIENSVSELKQMKDLDIDKCRTCQKDIWEAYLEDPSYGTEIGDYLTELGYADISMKLMKALYSNGTHLDDAKWEAAKYIYDAWWQFTNVSPRFSQSLAETGAIAFLTTILRKNNGKSDQFVKIGSIGTLHNMARHCENTDTYGFKTNRTHEALMPFMNSEVKMLRCLAMMTLAYLVPESEKNRLTDTRDVLKTLVKLISDPIHNIEEDGIFTSFSPCELLKAVARLAVVDDNKKKIIEAGALKVFLAVLQKGDTQEQAWTAECIRVLACQKTIRQTIIEFPGMVEALNDLKDCEDMTLKNNAQKTLQMVMAI